MIDHASEQFPLESCGLLAGRSGRIKRLIRTENVRASRSEFTMNPAELVQVNPVGLPPQAAKINAGKQHQQLAGQIT